MTVSVTAAAHDLPLPPASIFLVGIGGIGMSGLAQLLRWAGYIVGGSDRETSGPGRDRLYTQLALQGIRIWPQDGSGIREMKPAAVVFSSAVEKNNPERLAAADRPCLPRAQVLAAVLNQIPGTQIAIAGSAGKTTVTAWLASALRQLGESVLTVCGGYIHEFASDGKPGNFTADPTPRWLVYEVDESDGSLIAFQPHFGVVLNVGTDHFEREKLREFFSRFLANCRNGIVLPVDLKQDLTVPFGLALRMFHRKVPENNATDNTVRISDYQAGPTGITVTMDPFGRICLPQFGRHSAVNAAAVMATLLGLDLSVPSQLWLPALAAYQGVARRFDLAGSNSAGIPFFDDYAHNVEKISAAIQTAQEAIEGPLLILFQPHGFGPLKFMREALREALLCQLRPGDVFGMLPVYYAGGTTDFAPRADEVVAEYRQTGLAAEYYPDRKAAADAIRRKTGEINGVMVLGARDPSLPEWCRELVSAT